MRQGAQRNTTSSSRGGQPRACTRLEKKDQATYMGAQPHLSRVPVDQMQVGVVALGFSNRHDGVEPVDTSDKGSYLVRARQGATVLGNFPSRQPKSGRLADLRSVHGSWKGCKCVANRPSRGTQARSANRKKTQAHAKLASGPVHKQPRNERVHWECGSSSGLPPSQSTKLPPVPCHCVATCVQGVHTKRKCTEAENAHPMPSHGTQEGATAGASPAAGRVDMAEAHLPAGRLQAADTSAGRSRRAVVNIGRPRGEANAAPIMKMSAPQAHGQAQQKQRQITAKLTGSDSDGVRA